MPAFVRALFLLLTAHVRQWPLRTLLTIVGVAIGVSASVAVRTANVDVLRSFEQAVMTVAGPTTLEVSGGETGIDERVIITGPNHRRRHVRIAGDSSDGCSHDEESKPDQAVQVVGLDLLAEFNTRGFRISQPATESQLMAMIQPQAVFLGAEIGHGVEVCRSMTRSIC